MRALVIGRGSMGKRRIRDLTTLGVDVDSWDITDDGQIPPTARADTPAQDLVVVSTPPGTHGAALGWKGTPAHTFTEADVVPIDAPHFPSATPLFTDWFALFRRLVDGEVEPLAYTLHVGQHVADWHPGADPATYYAYWGNLAVSEMVAFELIWLTKLFGPWTASRACVRNRVFGLLVDHGPVAGHIVIDTLSRPAVRSFTMVSDGWTKRFDLTYTEAAYLAEMRALVEAIKGRNPWPYSQNEERANLAVLGTSVRGV